MASGTYVDGHIPVTSQLVGSLVTHQLEAAEDCIRDVFKILGELCARHADCFHSVSDGQLSLRLLPKVPGYAFSFHLVKTGSVVVCSSRQLANDLYTSLRGLPEEQFDSVMNLLIKIGKHLAIAVEVGTNGAFHGTEVCMLKLWEDPIARQAGNFALESGENGLELRIFAQNNKGSGLNHVIQRGASGKHAWIHIMYTLLRESANMQLAPQEQSRRLVWRPKLLAKLVDSRTITLQRICDRIHQGSSLKI